MDKEIPLTQKVAVVTDSIACLTRELVEEYGIGIIPVNFYAGGKIYKDCVDITPTEAYELFLKDPDSLRYQMMDRSFLVYLNNAEAHNLAQMYDTDMKWIRHVHNPKDPRVFFDMHPFSWEIIKRLHLYEKVGRLPPRGEAAGTAFGCNLGEGQRRERLVHPRAPRCRLCVGFYGILVGNRNRLWNLCLLDAPRITAKTRNGEARCPHPTGLF